MTHTRPLFAHPAFPIAMPTLLFDPVGSFVWPWALDSQQPSLAPHMSGRVLSWMRSFNPCCPASPHRYHAKTDSCGTAGGVLPGMGPGTAGATYVETPNAKLGDLGSKVLPPMMTGVKWTAGTAVEVAWTQKVGRESIEA